MVRESDQYEFSRTSLVSGENGVGGVKLSVVVLTPLMAISISVRFVSSSLVRAVSLCLREPIDGARKLEDTEENNPS